AEDRLIQSNQAFVKLLMDNKIPFTYAQSGGGTPPLTGRGRWATRWRCSTPSSSGTWRRPARRRRARRKGRREPGAGKQFSGDGANRLRKLPGGETSAATSSPGSLRSRFARDRCNHPCRLF